MLAACSKSEAGTSDAGTSAGSSSEPVESDQNSILDLTHDFDNNAKVAYGAGEYLRDKVTIATSDNWSVFNPYVRGSWGSEMMIYQTLSAVDSTGKMRLIMLKSVEEVDDMTYKCELWDFITDSEGNKFTADDVAFSMQTVIDNGSSGRISKLDHIEVTGDYTFVWHCKEPFGKGEMEAQFSRPSMVTKAGYEGHDATNDPVGTGPYVLKEFVAGSSIKLEANEDFWMRNITDEAWIKENNYALNYQNVKEVDWTIIADAGSRAMALEMGTVDACKSLNSADVANYVADPSLGISAINIPKTFPIKFYFNCNEASACSDVNLRKAFCYALDNAAIAAGLNVPAYAVYGLDPNMIDAPASWLSGEGRDYYNFNQEKAKEYLEKSSYDGSNLVIIWDGEAITGEAAILMQAELEAVGIYTELYPLEITALQDVQYNWTAWDVRFGGNSMGSYLYNALRAWTHEAQKNQLDGNLTVLGIDESEEFASLYADLVADTNDQTIEAYDDYFTFENCYAYSVCGYYEQTAAKSDVVVSLTGDQHNSLTPGAFTFTD